MRILIVTDAWFPQINGVVTTLYKTGKQLTSMGHDVHYLTPRNKRTIPMPTYPEIRLSLTNTHSIGKEISDIKPDCIHIATEGPLGYFARRYCLKNNLNFTTSFHSRFPEYISARFPAPGVEKFLYKLLHWFHNPAKATLTPTETVSRRLRRLGFSNIYTWTRGVDRETFRPRSANPFSKYPGPIYLNAGRVAVEKNLTEFLDLDLPGTKVVVGDGPQLESLKNNYSDVIFTGYKTGKELAETLSAADVFVFPSRTDTFGLVMIEALACGTPVAAFPVEGPIDVITSDKVGVLNTDLKVAIHNAMNCQPEDCIDYANEFSWSSVAELFELYIHPASS